MSTPEIHIHHTSMDANAHIWRVAATFLAIGAAVSLAWGLAQFGWLEIAATGLTATMAMMAQLMARNGFIVLPERTSDDARIAAGQSAVRDIIGMVQAWIDRSSILRLALLSIAWGVGFVVVRTIIAWALGIFANIWIAAAAGLFIASIICFPTLFAGVARAMRTARSRTKEQARATDEEVI